MADDLAVIYRAQTLQQAHLLKNLLSDRGIQAVVTNDVLAGGAGVDVVGWATLARVNVRKEDAEIARQIAIQFDETVSAEPELADEIDALISPGGGEEEDEWPRCPECDAARPTRCPICGTAGTDFPSADRLFFAVPEVEADATPISSCGCGSTGCSSEGPRMTEHPAAADAPLAADSEPDEPARMITCPTCDEPFVPGYPKQCEWCGHEFPDGYAVDGETPLLEPIPRRAVAVIFALVALGAALLIYFTLIV